ncbi:MAG: hypothetical protein KGJ86_16265 [Chloroflexota bacterium]|nr:hypothetical protein [Chloroflexota bacterium]
MFTPPVVGQTAELHHVVAEADTAHSLSNPQVRSLASPRLLHWIEQTASELWKGQLSENDVLLGIDFSFRHLAPSPVGSHITTRLTVIGVDRRKLTYRVEAVDEAGPICEGTYATFLMPLHRYLERMERRLKERAPAPALLSDLTHPR